MSFSSVFDAGLTANATKLSEISSEYATEITNCEAETTELQGLDAGYADLTAEKIAQNTAVCDALTTKQARITNIQAKIVTVQGLTDPQKATLYTVYEAVGQNARRFMDVVLDRYATIVSRADPIIADGALSTANRDKLLAYMFKEERILQKQTATDRLNYLPVTFE